MRLPTLCPDLRAKSPTRAREEELKTDLTAAIRNARDWDQARAELLRKHRDLFAPLSRIERTTGKSRPEND